ncbi:MAG: hypothetical protein LBU34_10670 [Planctomycetaceae bacterium]|jgi:hypothetical protein|nr:hypothetical protein [Planctomycetaceae bacterium]
MSPRTGRPKIGNSRPHKFTVYLSDQDLATANEIRNRDKKPEEKFSTWLARVISETIREKK